MAVASRRTFSVIETGKVLVRSSIKASVARMASTTIPAASRQQDRGLDHVVLGDAPPRRSQPADQRRDGLIPPSSPPAEARGRWAEWPSQQGEHGLEHGRQPGRHFGQWVEHGLAPFSFCPAGPP